VLPSAPEELSTCSKGRRKPFDQTHRTFGTDHGVFMRATAAADDRQLKTFGRMRLVNRQLRVVFEAGGVRCCLGLIILLRLSSSARDLGRMRLRGQLLRLRGSS
jgi:hypothetical protein